MRMIMLYLVLTATHALHITSVFKETCIRKMMSRPHLFRMTIFIVFKRYIKKCAYQYHHSDNKAIRETLFFVTIFLMLLMPE